MRSGRVVLVSDYAGSGGATTGGAGHAILDSLNALRDCGVDVRLIVGFGGAGAPGTTDLGGSDLRDAGRYGAARAIYNPASLVALRDALAGFDRADTLVILHQWTRYLSPSAVGLVSAFPTMIYLHDHFWACPNGAYYDFAEGRPCDRMPLGPRCLAAPCDRRGHRAKIGRVARHVALAAVARRGHGRRLLLHLSGRARRTIAPLLPRERHVIVHNPLSVPATAPDPPTNQCYDIGYFGRLEEEKGLIPLMDALSASGRSGLFVGDGSLAPAIRERSGFTLERWRPRDRMAAAMRSCRIVVLPSLWPETWGLIVPEAMAAGVPVLVSDRAGSAELIERFGGGLLFDPGQANGVADGIEALLAHPPSTPVSNWTGFRAALSAGSHARRLIALAASQFGLDLLRRASGPSARART